MEELSREPERVIVVNKNNRVLKLKVREEAERDGDIYRVIYVAMPDANWWWGLFERPTTKKLMPGHELPFFGGAMSVDAVTGKESYKRAGLREITEEVPFRSDSGKQHDISCLSMPVVYRGHSTAIEKHLPKGVVDYGNRIRHMAYFGLYLLPGEFSELQPDRNEVFKIRSVPDTELMQNWYFTFLRGVNPDLCSKVMDVLGDRMGIFRGVKSAGSRTRKVED